MRVTIVTAYFAPEISPITHLYRDLAEELSRQGAEVTVVTNLPARGLTPSAQTAYLSRRDEQTPEGYRVRRVGTPGTEGSGIACRGLRLLSGAVSLYRTAKATPTDVYLLGSMPPFLGPIGALLHKRARTVYVLQDIFPDTLLLMGKHREGHPFIRLGRWMERTSYRGNGQLVTLSPDMAKTLKSRGVPSDRLTVIGNWADTETVRPVPRADNPLFDELGLDRNGFYAVYAGTLGPLQCPDLLLDSFLSLSVGTKNELAHRDEPGQTPSPVTLLIFGSGSLLAHVQERIAREGMDNVRLFPLLPEERSKEVYSLGDVALVPLAKGTLACAMPSKTWTAMAAGRPLIVTAEPDSALAEMVTGANCGWVVPPEDAAALAAAIREAVCRRDELPALSENARRYATDHLSRREAANRYFEVLSKEPSHV